MKSRDIVLGLISVAGLGLAIYFFFDDQFIWSAVAFVAQLVPAGLLARNWVQEAKAMTADGAAEEESASDSRLEAMAILGVGAVLAIVGLVLTGMSFAGDDPKVHAVMFIATPFLLMGAFLLHDAKEQSRDQKVGAR